MSWFGGVMNGNNTAFEIELNYTNASSVQTYSIDYNTSSDMTNVWVDWGDGSAFEQVSDLIGAVTTITHTYADAGAYRFRVFQQDFELTTGNDFGFSGFDNDSNFPQLSSAAKMISFGLVNSDVNSFGNRPNAFHPWSFDYLQNYPIALDNKNFNNYLWGQGQNGYPSNFTSGWFSSPALSPTSLNSMFRSFHSGFNANLSGWDVSACTTMINVFASTSFNNGGDAGIDDWDVSSVTDIRSMFLFAPSFNQDIGSWDVSSVTTMSGMFRGASSFNQDISAWSPATTAANFALMLNDTAMSTTNYSRWLICLANWAYDNSYTTAESLGATSLTYHNTTYTGIGSGQYTDAVSARAYLVTTLGWTVTDGGVV